MIITDEKLLRLPCEDVLPEEVGELISSLERELDNSARLGRPGIGLSCPQIGIYKKLAIVRIDNLYKVDLVNCEIKDKYDPTVFSDEGCLSFPGKVEDTVRYQEIHAVNNFVHPYSFIATGLFAVCIQHELDHLDGVLFLDKAIQKKVSKKVRPNDICLCGSGKKFKRCCGI